MKKPYEGLHAILKRGKRILKSDNYCSCSNCESDKDNTDLNMGFRAVLVVAVIIFVFGILFMTCNPAHAENKITIKGYSDSDICEAIRQAENSKSHPYGIMVKYKHTSPKQACLNTIKHRRAQWLKDGGNGDFISFISYTYAPINASNDPQGLNKNWVRNVKYFLEKGK